ncbi:Trk-type K+ transport system, membrane component [Arcanobacterium phocae]|uniref:Trk-type K+ transport system, membrane component n=1 Tax=Arcanobacterium phocae TaxID=131112 RepID=A0A1H2L9P5_9ACTO|nr:potassium transporter TrkG [Arcanobacterium phocae]SDU77767.1 Trk-type K+ transport system, membrane component [Arcanobacterium phocae]
MAHGVPPQLPSSGRGRFDIRMSLGPDSDTGTTGHSVRSYINSLARRSPARLAMLVFAALILTITLLLMLPFATRTPGSTSFVTALFTATSAVCVTGLTVVDTATQWTVFGDIVLALGIQIGGLGVMVIASILALAVSRHLGLTQRMLAATETKSRLGDVGALLRAVIATSLVAETVLTLIFLATFVGIDPSFISALGHSLFMAVSTFNNAGFVVLADGLGQFVGNWAVSLPIILGTIVGAVGFPVTLNIAQHLRHPHDWTLHSKLTLVTYGSILGISIIVIGLLEWNNPATLGGLSGSDRILATLFHATTPRSSGLATLDVGQMEQSTWFFIDVLMFIGGGSASTGGGIKVTTFAVLVLAIVAEARGDRDTEAFGKRIPPDVVRLAISATFLGAFLVGTATLAILQITNYSLSQVLFEVISAFATCGLSTGITPTLPESAQIILIVLMYLGRVGTMTLAAALALRNRRRVIRLPEERPVIG